MESEPHRTCCRKAMLYGLFINAKAEDRNVCAEFKVREVAERVLLILSKQFSAEGVLLEYKRAGREFFSVSVKSKALSSFLQELDSAPEGTLMFSLVNFKCAECAGAFLSGAFMACGTLNDPHCGYHLEFSFSAEHRRRAELFGLFLSGLNVGEPKTVDRKTKIGVYYKKNLAITDLLYLMGATRSNFDMANICIEKDISNRENRATNCVAQNISRSVVASLKQIEAIERLERSGRLEGLGKDICYTAELRVENPSASLSELALMHEPPISKSGLNRRLTRILEEAEVADSPS